MLWWILGHDICLKSRDLWQHLHHSFSFAIPWRACYPILHLLHFFFPWSSQSCSQPVFQLQIEYSKMHNIHARNPEACLLAERELSSPFQTPRVNAFLCLSTISSITENGPFQTARVRDPSNLRTLQFPPRQKGWVRAGSRRQRFIGSTPGKKSVCLSFCSTDSHARKSITTISAGIFPGTVLYPHCWEHAWRGGNDLSKSHIYVNIQISCGLDC